VFKKKIPIKVAFWIVATLGSLIFLDMMRMIASTIILGEAPNFWKVKLF
jgi:hypothetical protein